MQRDSWTPQAAAVKVPAVAVGQRELSLDQHTHREMIPGGKLFGIALVSTQKALSLVQEQVGGQRGILGGRLASPPIGASSRTGSSSSSHREAAGNSCLHSGHLGTFLGPASSILALSLFLSGSARLKPAFRLEVSRQE